MGSADLLGSAADISDAVDEPCAVSGVTLAELADSTPSAAGCDAPISGGAVGLEVSFSFVFLERQNAIERTSRGKRKEGGRESSLVIEVEF